MKFEVVSTREFSEEDLQYAVGRAQHYYWEDRIDELCHCCYWDMVERIDINSSAITEEWEWCIFEDTVKEEIKRRLEAVENTKRKIELLRQH